MTREEVDRLVDHVIRLKLDSRIVTLARALLERDDALNHIAGGVRNDTSKARSYGGASWVSLTRKEMQEIAREAMLPRESDAS